MDELIVRAERQSKAKYIKDAQFFRSAGSKLCYEMDYKAGVVGAANKPAGAESAVDTETN